MYLTCREQSTKFYDTCHATPKPLTMSERDLQDILRKLKSSRDYADIPALLSKAKLTLLKLKALTPTAQTPSSTLLLAREVFEIGALLSIRATQPEAFTRYVHQLTPFYELPAQRLPTSGSEKNKITGLYLLLLLTQGDYAGFHTELEGLELREGREGDVEKDRYLGYPIKLERWLMEGSYDLVWKAMASREVPSEEYGVFSNVRSPHHPSILGGTRS
jgi:26S proteasome regulatory subunit N12